MFNELFNYRQEAVYLFNARQRLYAFIPENKRASYLAYHHRNFLILVIFALLSLTPGLSEWFNLAICTVLYLFMTWVYLTRLTPRADWQPLTPEVAAYPVFVQRFAPAKLKVNISLFACIVIAILLGMWQRQGQSLLLEILLALALTYETVRQLIIFRALRNQPLTLETPANQPHRVGPTPKTQLIKKKRK